MATALKNFSINIGGFAKTIYECPINNVAILLNLTATPLIDNTKLYVFKQKQDNTILTLIAGKAISEIYLLPTEKAILNAREKLLARAVQGSGSLAVAWLGLPAISDVSQSLKEIACISLSLAERNA